jgi:acetyltransferase-like isoleucine patch superfamily enzyme
MPYSFEYSDIPQDPNNHITSANDRPFIEQGHTNGKDLIIEDNVWIGCNVTLLEGAKICSNSIVAAGSVVNKEVTTNSIVGGVPAKLIKKRENNEN